MSHLAELQKLLGNDQALADAMAEKLETMPVGIQMRSILMRKRKDLSYYNKPCADALRPILDRMIESREAQEFHISDYPHMSVRTIYLKIYQAWLWLIDHDDPDQKYANLKRDTKIPQKTAYVRIIFKDSIGSIGTLHAHPVNLDMDHIGKLQAKISDFLDMAITEDTMFDEKKLSLTDEQLATIRDSVAGIPESMAKFMIEPTRIRILRRAQ